MGAERLSGGLTMISKMFVAVSTLLLLLLAVGVANAKEPEEITFVFISKTGAEYTYTLLGPESKAWNASVHARSSVVINGPTGLYGYILDGPDGIQHVGHITLIAGGRAEVIFNNFTVTERVGNPVPTPVPTEPETGSYTVLPGDSLIKIAKKFNVDLNVLAASNGIVNANLLTPGQVLLFLFDTYSVRSGDSLTRIARLFGVSLEELASLNNIVNLNSINVGQRLSIPE